MSWISEALDGLRGFAGGSAELAAWVQAVGTIAALLVALAIPAIQRAGDRRARRRIADRLFADVERDVSRIGNRLSQATTDELTVLLAKLRVCEQTLSVVPAFDLGRTPAIYRFFERRRLCRELAEAAEDLVWSRSGPVKPHVIIIPPGEDDHHHDHHGHGGGHDDHGHGHHERDPARHDRNWAAEFKRVR